MAKITAETPVAATLRATSSDPTKDKHAKSILRHRPILAKILQQVEPVYADLTLEEIGDLIDPPSIKCVPVAEHLPAARIDGIESADTIIGEGSVNFDVFFQAALPNEKTTKNSYSIYVDIEPQGILHPGYSLNKRALYYVSRMISRQIQSLADPKAAYDAIQKVCSIWICFADGCSKKAQGSVVVESLKQESLSGEYQIKEEDLDLLKIVFVVLSPNNSDNELVNFLGALFNLGYSADERKNLLLQHGIPVTEEIEMEVCEAMEGMYAYYEQTVLERGLEQGLEKGREEERRLMQAIIKEYNTSRDPEKAATAGGISVAEAEKILLDFGFQIVKTSHCPS